MGSSCSKLPDDANSAPQPAHDTLIAPQTVHDTLIVTCPPMGESAHCHINGESFRDDALTNSAVTTGTSKRAQSSRASCAAAARNPLRRRSVDTFASIPDLDLQGSLHSRISVTPSTPRSRMVTIFDVPSSGSSRPARNELITSPLIRERRKIQAAGCGELDMLCNDFRQLAV